MQEVATIFDRENEVFKRRKACDGWNQLIASPQPKRACWILISHKDGRLCGVYADDGDCKEDESRHAVHYLAPVRAISSVVTPQYLFLEETVHNQGKLQQGYGAQHQPEVPWYPGVLVFCSIATGDVDARFML